MGSNPNRSISEYTKLDAKVYSVYPSQVHWSKRISHNLFFWAASQAKQPSKKKLSFHLELAAIGLELETINKIYKDVELVISPTFIFFCFQQTLERFPKDETIWVSPYHLAILALSPQNTILAKIFWTFHYFEKCSLFSLQNNFFLSQNSTFPLHRECTTGAEYLFSIYTILSPHSGSPHTTPTSHPK